MRRLWTCAFLACLSGASLVQAGEPAVDAATTTTVLNEEVCACACDTSCGQNCWFTAEALLWWIKNHPVQAPLVSFGAVNPDGGFLATDVALGGGNLEAGVRLGGRFTLGGWVNDEQTIGAEASYFFLGPHDDSDSIASTGAPILVVGPRLLSSPQGNTLNAFPLAAPGQFADLSTLSVRTWLQGAEANALGNLANGSWGRLDVLGGFRYLQIDEELQSKSISPATSLAASLVSLDQFRCINNYYGGQLGLRAHLTRGRYFADCTAKVGLAHADQQQTVSGHVTFVGSPPGPGFFAGVGNIGTRDSDDLAWLGELTLNAGVNLSDSVRAFIGYNFLYVDEAQRPGEQISSRGRVVDQGATLLHETLDRDSAFWAQGLNFGIEFRF